MKHLTDKQHFFVGALWMAIGMTVTLITAQLLRNAPELGRLLGMLVIVVWIFFWFGSEGTIKIVYHIADALLKRAEVKK